MRPRRRCQGACAEDQDGLGRAGCCATAATGSGYVAVLSSKKSRMDALKIFADMQEKYGDVLASKTPDVQEANLGDEGRRHHVPPGRRAARLA